MDQRNASSGSGRTNTQVNDQYQTVQLGYPSYSSTSVATADEVILVFVFFCVWVWPALRKLDHVFVRCKDFKQSLGLV